jgi:hypothetical protein
MSYSRDQLIFLDDNALLNECRVDSFRGSGHGGQKRNVTNSAVRVTHVATGIAATCDDTRSQIKNRRLALAALRRRLAIEVRQACLPADWRIEPVPGKKTADYAVWIGRVLDALALSDYAVGAAAEAAGISTGRFIRLLSGEKDLWREVNNMREAKGMRRLKAR